MEAERSDWIRSRFDEIHDRGQGARRLCEVAAEVTALSGAGIMFATDGRPQGSLGATDSVSGLIEELQWTLGEGPCLDAHRLGVVVLEPSLAGPAQTRWPAFAPRVLEAGAEAVFGFPLRIGSTRLGALDLYRDEPGPLSPAQLEDARMAADVVALAVLQMQSEALPGTVAAGIADDGDFRLVVHQAAGMASVQLDVPVEEALLRLRALAFRTGRPVAELAEDVVARRLRLDGTPAD